eukprot:2857173-Prymnesium_polylepis.1
MQQHPHRRQARRGAAPRVPRRHERTALAVGAVALVRDLRVRAARRAACGVHDRRRRVTRARRAARVKVALVARVEHHPVAP